MKRNLFRTHGMKKLAETRKVLSKALRAAKAGNAELSAQHAERASTLARITLTFFYSWAGDEYERTKARRKKNGKR